MKGTIVIKCDKHGTHVHTAMKDVVKNDEIFLVHAIGKSLGLQPIDYQVLAIAEATGVLDKAVSPSMLTIDVDELRKQMKEEDQDAC